jgi:hypothetical protein
VIAGLLLAVGIIAERFFGFRLGRRQWIGLLVTAIGLAILGLTTAPVVREHASSAALIAVEGAVVALSGVLIAVSSRLETLHLRKGIVLGTAEGALFGTSDIRTAARTASRRRTEPRRPTSRDPRTRDRDARSSRDLRGRVGAPQAAFPTAHSATYGLGTSAQASDADLGRGGANWRIRARTRSGRMDAAGDPCHPGASPARRPQRHDPAVPDVLRGLPLRAG